MSEPAPLGISFPNILFQLVNFLVFLWILRRLLYGPVTRMLRERRERITESLREAEDLRAQVERDRTEFESELQRARAEAQRIRDEASSTAEVIRERELERARGDVERMRTEAQADVERAQQQAAAELRAQTADLVMQATSRVLDRSIDDPEHRRLVQEALADLQSQRL
jgi:F-type H+-transporting ATPase subunit b